MSSIDRPLSERLRRELLAGRVGAAEPGAVIAVYRDGELVAAASAGVADTETGELLTPQSLMNIASVSKQIVATALLLAAERGEIDLDADIRGLVPEIRIPGVTLRHCLQHTSGLPDYFAAATLMDATELEMSRLDAFLTWLATVEQPDFAPGTGQSYSNTGYVAAALATERATGRIFPELIAETVFRPLGMSSTFVATMLGAFVPGMAMSFTPENEGFTRHGMGIGELHEVRAVNGDGEVITSIEDFARWHGFLLDGRVLGAGIRSRLLERAVLSDGRRSTYALGIEHETRGDTASYGHSGGMWGYSAYSLTDPSTGIGVAVFANRDDIDATDLAWRGLRMATGAAGISGRWFSATGFAGVHLSVDANDDLEAQLGTGAEPDAVKTHLAKTGQSRWTRHDDLSVIEVVDGELFIATGFGLRERFVRMGEPGAYPPQAVGDFTEPFRDATYALEDREDELWIVKPNGEPERVEPFGSYDDEWIGGTSVGWIVIDSGPGARVRLGNESLIVELTRLAAAR
ncbi:serine hydrolase [Microbacterium sp. MYb64]|uniref:serine hydrolase domain-containing protein n=1 Tax=Microbacterium sp. MYb64 TaxID=1848691 RepID=UPI000CFD9E42|nr:serine hydrolase domain-containing protein [Microbacterium sp. MYb64]PRB09172.1 hypothetical protein CQ044_02160 [Microbacterium sp. MYb64]